MNNLITFWVRESKIIQLNKQRMQWINNTKRRREKLKGKVGPGENNWSTPVTLHSWILWCAAFHLIILCVLIYSINCTGLSGVCVFLSAPCVQLCTHLVGELNPFSICKWPLCPTPGERERGRETPTTKDTWDKMLEEASSEQVRRNKSTFPLLILGVTSWSTWLPLALSHSLLPNYTWRGGIFCFLSPMYAILPLPKQREE